MPDTRGRAPRRLSTLDFLITPAVLIWLRRGRPTRYRAARSMLALTTLFGLVGFVLLPTAPPAAGAGFHDTLAVFHAWGWWSGDVSAAPGGMDSATNQFAAMPSLHAAWSLWRGWHLARHAQRAWARILGGLYPVLTAAWSWPPRTTT
ncbi:MULTISPECIES: phosphatase PAP2 family protein [Frankia]|uniref:phosphatase PAP2 family protein n=1 Tax=Frankia TaxID=1854 RepID=UPI00211771B5|nr:MULTISPECIES: phosphatase PAP2 family protein [Frankia]